MIAEAIKTNEKGKITMAKNILFIEGKRTGYSPDQCGETMTVGQLLHALEAAIEWGELSADMPIYLSNDSGYTYGEISSWNSFSVGEKYDDADRWEPMVAGSIKSAF